MLTRRYTEKNSNVTMAKSGDALRTFYFLLERPSEIFRSEIDEPEVN